MLWFLLDCGVFVMGLLWGFLFLCSFLGQFDLIGFRVVLGWDGLVGLLNLWLIACYLWCLNCNFDWNWILKHSWRSVIGCSKIFHFVFW